MATQNANPITPDEVLALKTSTLPPEVFEVFNQLIAANWNGAAAIVAQKDVVAAIRKKLRISREQVYERNLLEVEECYWAAGWHVEYDKPAFNEPYYEPTFTFRKRIR
jgi:hypothetical protein